MSSEKYKALIPGARDEAWTALRRTDYSAWTAARMYFVGGIEAKEIARQTDYIERTVWRQLARARKFFLAYIAEHPKGVL